MRTLKKKIILILYGIVVVLLGFDLLYRLISLKLQVMHYTTLAKFALGRHLTYFLGVYPWAFMLFLIIPIFFICFSRKKILTIVLGVALFIVHLIIVIIGFYSMEQIDNDREYYDYGEFSSVENEEKGIKICVQNVYINPEEGYCIIALQTGINTLKKVKECDFTIYNDEISAYWGKDMVVIGSEAFNGDRINIDISYDELKRAAGN